MPKKAKPPPPVEPGATGEEVLIHKLPGVIHDHVRDNMILTETFAKEDRTLHRLADLQKHATGSDPKHLQYRPNPFNKSRKPLNNLRFYKNTDNWLLFQEIISTLSERS